MDAPALVCGAEGVFTGAAFAGDAEGRSLGTTADDFPAETDGAGAAPAASRAAS